MVIRWNCEIRFVHTVGLWEFQNSETGIGDWLHKWIQKGFCGSGEREFHVKRLGNGSIVLTEYSDVGITWSFLSQIRPHLGDINIDRLLIIGYGDIGHGVIQTGRIEEDPTFLALGLGEVSHREQI